MLTDRSTIKTLQDKGSNIEALAAVTFDASLCWKVQSLKFIHVFS